MSDEGDIHALVLTFLGLSLISVGGGIAVLPEMSRMVVQEHGWMSQLQFAKLFALAQAAPGPNIMVVGLIGWHVAGAAGMFLAMLAMCGPTSLLAYGFSRLQRREFPWLKRIEKGLVPIAIGLIAASGLLLAEGTVREAPPVLAVVLASFVFVWRTARSPLWVLLGGAAFGAAVL